MASASEVPPEFTKEYIEQHTEGGRRKSRELYSDFLTRGEPYRSLNATDAHIGARLGYAPRGPLDLDDETLYCASAKLCLLPSSWPTTPAARWVRPPRPYYTVATNALSQTTRRSARQRSTGRALTCRSRPRTSGSCAST